MLGFIKFLLLSWGFGRTVSITPVYLVSVRTPQIIVFLNLYYNLTAMSDVKGDIGNQGVTHSFAQPLSQRRVLCKADFHKCTDTIVKQAARKVYPILQRIVFLRFSSRFHQYFWVAKVMVV
jgi:hypothetical protein